jgi:hypothetical protein
MVRNLSSVFRKAPGSQRSVSRPSTDDEIWADVGRMSARTMSVSPTRRVAVPIVVPTVIIVDMSGVRTALKVGSSGNIKQQGNVEPIDILNLEDDQNNLLIARSVFQMTDIRRSVNRIEMNDMLDE